MTEAKELHGENKVSALLEKGGITEFKSNPYGATVKTDRGAYNINSNDINGIRGYVSNERTLGALTGADVFETLRAPSSYKTLIEKPKNPEHLKRPDYPTVG